MDEDTRLYDREAKEAREAALLAPWARRSADSRGRRFPEPPDDLRTCWERDRDRIVHCTAFRRLMYKTQVFVNWEGDHNRTRLSHSLEVAQVARSIGSPLHLNEPLCEALALAHDLGHPPFGHRGEWALDRLMTEHGGFRHNAQVLRVVDHLERRNPDYPGLNLTRELRESLLKHEKDEDWPDEFTPRPRRPCVEAQVVDLADSTAYIVHDVEDGLRARMFDESVLEEGSALWRRARARIGERHAGFLEDTRDAGLRIKRLTNEVIGIVINDLIAASSARLAAADLDSPEAAQAHDRLLIDHSAEIGPEVAELHALLYARFYRHEYLKLLTDHADEVLPALFEVFVDRPDEMASWYRTWVDEVGLERAVCDYLAGMTDRFAESEFTRLLDREPSWSRKR
jgi:dGTPase